VGERAQGVGLEWLGHPTFGEGSFAPFKSPSKAPAAIMARSRPRVPSDAVCSCVRLLSPGPRAASYVYETRHGAGIGVALLTPTIPHSKPLGDHCPRSFTARGTSANQPPWLCGSRR